MIVVTEIEGDFLDIFMFKMCKQIANLLYLKVANSCYRIIKSFYVFFWTHKINIISHSFYF